MPLNKFIDKRIELLTKENQTDDNRYEYPHTGYPSSNIYCDSFHHLSFWKGRLGLESFGWMAG